MLGAFDIGNEWMRLKGVDTDEGFYSLKIIISEIFLKMLKFLIMLEHKKPPLAILIITPCVDGHLMIFISPPLCFIEYIFLIENFIISMAIIIVN